MNDLTSKPPQWCSALGAVCDHSMEWCKKYFEDCENRQKSMRDFNQMPDDTKKKKKKKKKFFRILQFSRI
ncbi:hypothetical protein WAI453_002163 [Rhynchosporium graminicola]